jgi:hypothetical protein
MNRGTQRPVVALLDAAEGLVSAGQQALLDRIDLVRTEATEDARAIIVGMAWVAGACTLVTLGWAFVVSGIMLALLQVMPASMAALAVGLPQLVGGAVLALAAGQHMRRAPTALVLDSEGTDA